MASPGIDAIASEIGKKTYTVEGGFNVQFKTQSPSVQKLATAIDAGWTSSAPSTITTMATAITAEFTLASSAGLAYLIAIGTGIDSEIGKWAASFNATTSLHAYVPTALLIVTAIMAASPVKSAGALALAQVVANVFITNFEQEAG